MYIWENKTPISGGITSSVQEIVEALYWYYYFVQSHFYFFYITYSPIINLSIPFSKHFYPLVYYLTRWRSDTVCISIDKE